MSYLLNFIQVKAIEINLVSPEKEKASVSDPAPLAADVRTAGGSLIAASASASASADLTPLINDVDKLDGQIAEYRRKMVSHDSAMELIKSVSFFNVRIAISLFFLNNNCGRSGGIDLQGIYVSLIVVIFAFSRKLTIFLICSRAFLP